MWPIQYVKLFKASNYINFFNKIYTNIQIKNGDFPVCFYIFILIFQAILSGNNPVTGDWLRGVRVGEEGDSKGSKEPNNKSTTVNGDMEGGKEESNLSTLSAIVNGDRGEGGRRQREVGGIGAREGGPGLETRRRRIVSVTPKQREEAWGRLMGGPNKEEEEAREARGMYRASAKAIEEAQPRNSIITRSGPIWTLQ